MKILLWDIDGTLIRSGLAGSRSMSAAAGEVFGLPGAFEGFDLAGRTDPWAVDAMCARHGLRPAPEQVERFYACYVSILRAALHNPNARVCAGVRELLEHFHARSGIVQGLLTGNILAGSRVKLEHFGLWHYFRFGAFGDDSGDRNQLGPVALRRAREHLGHDGLRPEDFVIIGDTPHDIACARASGFRCAIAATGGYPLEELAPHRPGLLVADFTDPRVLIDYVEGLG